MKKTFFTILFIASIHHSFSQNDEVKTVINTFFEGLHTADTTLINSVISKNILMQTTFINSKGESILRSSTKKDFFTTLLSKKEEDVWFEKLLSVEIKIDGNIASVWIPYEFYLNDIFSHCGANSFQLYYNNNNHWEIIYIIDTRRKKDCKSKL
ncbi:nuclear transport factor 2 family protein [uncultured Lutibacter sp.]|uniref:nuclear transport factor 2 family protein n=1 Tax=uncultured Lutibacter sp. TaxID=437739 RepID=UPI002627ED09|nr:nuclear transport factor 2 family protein [uncultured Lutibacter sp.]